jgi:hypothetical protein
MIPDMPMPVRVYRPRPRRSTNPAPISARKWLDRAPLPRPILLRSSVVECTAPTIASSSLTRCSDDNTDSNRIACSSEHLTIGGCSGWFEYLDWKYRFLPGAKR